MASPVLMAEGANAGWLDAVREAAADEDTVAKATALIRRYQDSLDPAERELQEQTFLNLGMDEDVSEASDDQEAAK